MKWLILQQFEHFVNNHILDGFSPTQLSYAAGFKSFVLSLRADTSYFTRLYTSVSFSLENCNSVIVFYSSKKLVRSSSLMAVGSCPFVCCFLASPMSWSRDCRTDASRLAYSAVLRIKLQRATGKFCWRQHVLAVNM